MLLPSYLMTFSNSNVCGKIQFWSLYLKDQIKNVTVTILPNYIYFKKLGFFKEHLLKLFQNVLQNIKTSTKLETNVVIEIV